MLLFFSDLEISQKLWNCLFEKIMLDKCFGCFILVNIKKKMKNIVFDALECKNSDAENN